MKARVFVLVLRSEVGQPPVERLNFLVKRSSLSLQAPNRLKQARSREKQRNDCGGEQQ